jgi:hypothetical protein
LFIFLTVNILLSVIAAVRMASTAVLFGLTHLILSFYVHLVLVLWLRLFVTLILSLRKGVIRHGC